MPAPKARADVTLRMKCRARSKLLIIAICGSNGRFQGQWTSKVSPVAGRSLSGMGSEVRNFSSEVGSSGSMKLIRNWLAFGLKAHGSVDSTQTV